MDSRRDFTSKKVFPGHFSELGEKANSALLPAVNEDLWNAHMHGNMDIGPDSDAEGTTATNTHTDESE